MADDKLESLIEQIYRASVEPDLWYEVVRGVKEVTGCAEVTYLGWPLQAEDDTPLFMYYDLMDPGYIEYYGQVVNEMIDPRASYLRLNMTRPGIFDDREALETRFDEIQATLERTPFYDAFLKPLELGPATCVTTIVNQDLNVAAGMGLHRARKTGPHSKRERAVIEQILPHISRASNLHLTLQVHKAREAANAILALEEVAVFILSVNGTVTSMNAAAEELLRAADGVTLKDRFLHSLDATSDTLIPRAIEPWTKGIARTPPEPFHIPRPSGKAPYRVTTYPLPGDLVGPNAIALIVEDRARPSLRGIDTLSESHLMTPAEVELAKASASGQHPTEFADESGRSLNTVKTHQKAVFAKLEVNSRTELVHKLAAMGYVKDQDTTTD